jgi:hypothetical protein
VIVTHPNRDKPVVQGTRAIVVVLFLVSAALVAVVTVCGWNLLEGAIPIQVGYIVIYLLMAFFASRWNRGVLPVGAALAVLLAIFSLAAGPGWFDQQIGLRGPRSPQLGSARRADAADRPGADAAGGVCDARLQPGLERRARAS